MSLLRMLVKKKAEENSVSTETVQQTSLESPGKHRTFFDIQSN